MTASHIELTSRRRGLLTTGTVGVLFTAAYLWFSRDLPMGQIEQPGARVFPLVVGALLLVASIAVLWDGWRTPPDATTEWPAGAARKRLLLLVALLFLYFLALPWLGLLAASTLFCIGLVRLVSEQSWPRTVGLAFAMALALYLVFVVLLKVPLPKAQWLM